MKKIIIIAVIAVLIVGGIVAAVVLGNKNDENKDNGKAKVELEKVDVTYTYPWNTQIWKNYKVTVGYPKKDNWVANEDGETLVLKDEARKLEVEFKVDQVSEATWNQNSKQRKESMNGTDNKWGEYEGFYYTIAQNTYNGWLYLGNPTSIEKGTKGTHVNKLEFKIQSKGETTLEELIKIMDEDILPNISWEEID